MPFLWVTRNANSVPSSLHQGVGLAALYRYSWEDGAANVSSPESDTMSSQPPGTITVFSWLWRPMPAIGGKSPCFASMATE